MIKSWTLVAVPVVITMVLVFILLGNYSGVPDSQSRMLLNRVRLPSEKFIQTSSRWASLEHLIIVPGHAIQWCTDRGQDLFNEDCWYLLEYQKGQVPIFLEHIRRAANLAAEDNTALLLFSGGKTRGGLGPRSEGQSYFFVAERLGLLSRNNLFDRSTTEEFARDSLENLIFSLCRFRMVTGRMPAKVTVVGFPFKARRFAELHRKAAGIDPDAFAYIPVKVPGFPQDRIIDDAHGDFANDLFGCGPKLSSKRQLRNPYHEHHGYLNACPELRHQLTRCQ